MSKHSKYLVLLHCIGKLATMANYLPRELRYTDAGDEAQGRFFEPIGTPGYQ